MCEKSVSNLRRLRAKVPRVGGCAGWAEEEARTVHSDTVWGGLAGLVGGRPWPLWLSSRLKTMKFEEGAKHENISLLKTAAYGEI